MNLKTAFDAGYRTAVEKFALHVNPQTLRDLAHLVGIPVGAGALSGAAAGAFAADKGHRGEGALKGLAGGAGGGLVGGALGALGGGALGLTGIGRPPPVSPCFDTFGGVLRNAGREIIQDITRPFEYAYRGSHVGGALGGALVGGLAGSTAQDDSVTGRIKRRLGL